MSLEPSATLPAAEFAARFYCDSDCIIDQSLSNSEHSQGIIHALAHWHVCDWKPLEASHASPDLTEAGMDRNGQATICPAVRSGRSGQSWAALSSALCEAWTDPWRTTLCSDATNVLACILPSAETS